MTRVDGLALAQLCRCTERVTDIFFLRNVSCLPRGHLNISKPFSTALGAGKSLGFSFIFGKVWGREKEETKPNPLSCILRPSCSLTASPFPLCQYLSIYAATLNENEATNLAILDVIITQAHSYDKPIALS